MYSFVNDWQFDPLKYMLGIGSNLVEIREAARWFITGDYLLGGLIGKYINNDNTKKVGRNSKLCARKIQTIKNARQC